MSPGAAREGRFRIPVFRGVAAFERDPRRRGAAPGSPARAAVREAVAAIVERVRAEGDAALVALAREFDRIDLDPASLRLAPGEIGRLAAAASGEDRELIARTRTRIADYHERQREASFRIGLSGGGRLEWRALPVRAAGVYVPGGAAVYPSTVLMNTVPARVAGVPRVALATPPGALERSPALVAAIEASGVSEVYRMGGAGAIAAFAWGTESVAPVGKVVGPGNAYVAEAKRQVSGVVGVDSFAGPSEVVVVADETASAGWIAADLIAQAEHGSGDERAILITPSRRLALEVADAIARQAKSQPNAETIAVALGRFGATVIVGDLDEAVAAAETIAPEHLQVMTRDPDRLADRFPSAGAVFLGGYSPTAAGDYGGGPNHVLPTGGAARFASPLWVGDFLKRQSLLAYEREDLRGVASDFARFARLEGLEAHARSIEARFRPAGPAPPRAPGKPLSALESS